jgi:ParB family chromosome partitioning protein
MTTHTDTTVLGTIEYLDPNDLDNNVRDDAAVDPEFMASVKEHGVLTPIAAVRDQDGTIRVRAGQHQTFPGKLPCCLGASCRSRCGDSLAGFESVGATP